MPAQLQLFSVPSPCIGVCETGERGFCKGCFRSRDERLYWLQLDDATKRTIVKACYRRKVAAARKKKTATQDLTEDNKQSSLFD